ncbi:MAG: thioredoxin domain-containing protein, partial [Bifidobacteriaceae bacterium]|nr:thioredoxin domain-containing protein [Bifidobacteriaceae bacterium]
KRLAEGYINLKIIPLAWIDFYSNGHHYSIRAARAAEIVFRNQPELAWDFIELLLKRGVQPREAANYDPEQGSNLHLAKLAASLGAGGKGAGGKGADSEGSDGQGVSKQVLKEIENISDSDSLAKSMEKEAEIIRQNNLIPGTPSLFIDGKLWDFAAKL